MTLRRLALFFVALLFALPLGAQVPPNVEWRTLDTEHFRVHFTPALEPLARRAADRAETAYAALREVLVQAPRKRVDLVLSDNVDFSNGYATPLPSNRIVVYAHPPVDTPELAFYDDWLQLVVSHELVHIFHLDYAAGFPRLVRRVFGRTPLGFPNLLVPRWTQEGLATALESRMTRAGRVRATVYDMMLRTAILEDEFFSIDRATGYPVTWPGGSAPYVYGSLFMDYLGDRFGYEKHGDWVKTMGRRVPFSYGTDGAAKRAYGEKFTDTWNEWRDSLRTEYTALADSLRREGLTEPEVLVQEGRRTEGPRWSPDGRTIAFAHSTGREETSTRLWSEGGVRVLDPRTSLGASAWRADGSLVTSMLDAVDAYRYYSDLYVVRPNGDRDRITSGARLMDPDVHPASGRIVAVRGGGGTNVPVVMAADGSGARELATPSPDVHWSRPRWSPDGTRIAVSRWRTGALYDVVVLDAATGQVVRELTSDRAVDSSPAWSPDGRYVVFSSDRSGISNLYAYDLTDGRLQRITNVLTGAFDPDVSPDGRWIALTLYRADGYHLARMPFDPARWTAAPPLRAEVRQAGAGADLAQRTAGGAARAYSPLPSLRPTSWSPILESDEALGTGLGVAIGGQDVVQRHSYEAYTQVHPRETRTEAGASYLFTGLGNPVIGASVFQEWDRVGAFATVTPTDEPTIATLLERERSASLVATFTRPRFRSFSWLSVGAGARQRDYSFRESEVTAPAPNPPAEAGGAVTLGYSNAREYEYSVSPEEGFVAAASVEGRRYLDDVFLDNGPGGGQGDAVRGYVRTTARAQHYLPFRGWGYARHVLGLRVAGGADHGSLTPGYSVGGTEGGVSAFPLSTFVTMGSELDLPVRGYREGVLFGDRAVAGTLEWRFPLALIERGRSVMPVYLDRLWGSAFVDAGRTWCSDDCLTRGVRGEPSTIASVGAELGLNLSISYLPPFPVRAGVGFPLRSITVVEDDIVLRERPKPRGYLTFGLSF
jgi:Tol biopolymer transport system component